MENHTDRQRQTSLSDNCTVRLNNRESDQKTNEQTVTDRKTDGLKESAGESVAFRQCQSATKQYVIEKGVKEEEEEEEEEQEEEEEEKAQRVNFYFCQTRNLIPSSPTHNGKTNLPNDARGCSFNTPQGCSFWPLQGCPF